MGGMESFNHTIKTIIMIKLFLFTFTFKLNKTEIWSRFAELVRCSVIGQKRISKMVRSEQMEMYF